MNNSKKKHPLLWDVADSASSAPPFSVFLQFLFFIFLLFKFPKQNIIYHGNVTKSSMYLILCIYSVRTHDKYYAFILKLIKINLHTHIIINMVYGLGNAMWKRAEESSATLFIGAYICRVHVVTQWHTNPHAFRPSQLPWVSTFVFCASLLLSSVIIYHHVRNSISDNGNASHKLLHIPK